MPAKKFDLIVFGASSFVGEILTRYLAETFGVDGDLHWAIAGRSERKLQTVRGTLAPILGDKAKDVQILLADAADETQLQELTSKTKVVVSTVGPYALYGEPLVKVCAENGVDYCDLTGEAQWIKRMLAKYENTAQESGARIVHCCGFDSVPSDMGVYFLQQQAEQEFGEMASRIKMRVKAAKGGMSGGTVASIINLTKEAIANPGLRKELANPFSICPADAGFKTRQPNIKSSVFDADFNAWSAPFIMAAINTRVVHRSNALRDKAYGESFIYDEAMLMGKGVKGRMSAMALVAGLGAFMLGAVAKPTRWLLENYVLPKPGEGPTPQQQLDGFYDIRFKGFTDDGRSITTKVTGDRDPGYGSTAKILGQAAASLALDFHNGTRKKGKKGGFWTPASIFDERYIQRLRDHAGLEFEVVEK
ncbi:trans-acting enoyl reductase family protein [Bacterioplanoides sp. SCSIO 12839]|uniref:saccharopine dehydrogenase family protein n=1 Tax=Bacterioplanoides sp. SCSIO 12839 TaxID=2829569 RepID=UPI002105CCC1|nr:saccharopine dehydrogenase NADP-binding domain-containing protein [Bacterioplanoides sp. SCSIO 12839]UTW49331.1 saccharopine dehydrogenase NADP-binding domain-containing protein [Bacterioplanoides sp. SCSIO 12839]